MRAGTRKGNLLRKLVLALLLLTPLMICAQSATPVPLLVRYGGTLPAELRATGARVTFTLYSQQEDGSALWSEEHTVAASTRGDFQARLGQLHADGIPLELFTTGEARWLGVRYNDGPEQPRIMLLSVPYALKAADAATLGGLPPSAFQLAAPAGTVASSAAAPTSTLAGNPPAQLTLPQSVTNAWVNFLPLFTNTSGDMTSSVIYQASNGALGVNTMSPASGFHVATNLPGIATFQRINGARFTFQNYLDNDSTGAGSIFYVTDSTATKYQPLKFDAYTLQMRPNGDPAQSFYLDQTGKLGLGTASPTERLTVNGNVQLAGGGLLKFGDGTTQSTAAVTGTLGAADNSVTVGGGAGAQTIAVASGGITDAKVHDVAATKITGTLADSQIAALSAAKLTGTVADSQIASVSAAKISGTIPLTQISATGNIEIGDEALRLLRTRCTGTSSTLSCSGTSFTASKTSTGTYKLTMATAFAASDVPAVTVSAVASGSSASSWCSVRDATYESFTVACFNLTGAADADFNVIVLGAR